MRIRAIQGSQEEQHVLSMNGIRWREEFGDPNSPLVNAKTIGISEAFNFEVPTDKLRGRATPQACAGDYLYGGTATDDKYLGAWGLLRARAEQVPSLRPLPDNDPAVTDTTPEPGESAQSVSATSSAPPEATSPGNPCPTNAPVKTFNVVAMQARIDYNEEGDNDPYGLVYALAEDEAAIRSGELEPEPLVLRANQEDCIRVRLTNKLTNGWLQGHGNAGTNGDPTLPTEPASGTRAGLRVSMNPQLVKYDVQGSDGAAVGFNRDSTVAPGDTRDYRWYADSELGTTNLTDFGDVRGHRHHGLFAGLNIEPENATYHDPETGDPITSGVSADIRVPNAPDFREFTTFFQDGLNLRDASGAIIEDPLDHPPTPEEPAGEPMDAEDMGGRRARGLSRTPSPGDAHRLRTRRRRAARAVRTRHGTARPRLVDSPYAGHAVRHRRAAGDGHRGSMVECGARDVRSRRGRRSGRVCQRTNCGVARLTTMSGWSIYIPLGKGGQDDDPTESRNHRRRHD